MALKLGKCRLCLKLGDFYSIFTVDNNLQLAEMVMECARVKIQEGDGLPDKICSECIQKLSSSHIFKQQCERSDQELRRNYVPPPGFSAPTPPPPTRQSSDSAFSTDTSKPASSFESKVTPTNRVRKRSTESIDNVSNSSLSHEYTTPGTSKRVEELRKTQRKRKMPVDNSDSDFDDNSSFQPSPFLDGGTDSDEPVEFKCDICSKAFKSYISMNAHKKSHSKQKKALARKLAEQQSSPPGTPFQPEIKLADAHDVEDNLKCGKCGKTFKLNIMLKRHVDLCGKIEIDKQLKIALEPIDGLTNQNKIDCTMCSTKFKTIENLEKHMRVVHAAVLKRESPALQSENGKIVVPCFYCRKPFYDFYSHSAHFRVCPKRDDALTFVCTVCNKALMKKASYFLHVKSHFFPVTTTNIKQDETTSNENICRFCSLRFTTQEELINHLAAHISNAEDGIDGGDEESRASTLDDSASVHSEYNSSISSGPYKCSICGKGFKYKKALATHEAKHDQDTNSSIKMEPPDGETSDLLSETIQEDNLNQSDFESSHGEEEDNTCDICERQFSYKRLLIQHKRIKHHMTSGTKRAKINLKDCTVRCLICDIEMKVSMINEHNQKHITANMKPRNLYTCIECEQQFKSCSALANHIKIVHRLQMKQQAPKVTIPADLADFCEVVVTKAEPLDFVQSHSDFGEASAGDGTFNAFTCPTCSKVMPTLISLKRHMNWHTNVGNNMEKKLECFVCNETFRFNCHYKLHMRQHYHDTNLDPKHLTCPICNRKSKHLRAAQAHMKYHQQTRFQNKDYECAICKRVFQYRKVYLSHMAIHFKRGESANNTVIGSAIPTTADKTLFDGTHTCKICGKVCDSESNLKHHMGWHNSKTLLYGARYECEICNLQFTNKKRLELHNRTHYEDENGPFKCHICGKGYIAEEYFKRHVKGHNFDHQSHKKRIERLRKNKVKCPICTKYYPDLVKLIRHLRKTHPESKMIKQDPDAPAPKYYPCKLCAKVFLDERRLQHHEEAHLRKPELYKCKFCKKTSMSLKNHRIHIKGHLTQKYIDTPLKCEHCDETFTRGYDLHYHLRDVHKIEETWIADRNKQDFDGPLKEFQCSVCYKVLASKGNFERHIDYHNSLRCNYCFEYFSTLRFLEGHLSFSCEKRQLLGNTEVYPKRVKCHICYKAFHVQVKLDCHLRTQHGIKSFKEASESKKEIVCDYCFRVFENEFHLASHKLYHRTLGYYGCLYCNRKFNTMTTYRKHKNHHFAQLNVDNPTKCEHCDETFVPFREFIYHMRDVHGDDKEWVVLPKEIIEEKCNICNKIFYNLQRHLAYHEENRCKKCVEYVFSRADYDNNICHIDSDDEVTENSQNDIRPKYEECRFCFKPVTYKTKKMHELLHKGSGSISCRFCVLKFKTIDAFNIHAFSHRSSKYKKRPLRCRICRETFIKYGPFMRHMKNVHKSIKKMHYRATIKPEQCVVCKEDFPNLHNHYRAHLQNQCLQCHKYFTSSKLFSQHQCDKEDGEESKVFTCDANLPALINSYVPVDEKDDEKFYGYENEDEGEENGDVNANSELPQNEDSQNSADTAESTIHEMAHAPIISDVLSLYQSKVAEDVESKQGSVVELTDDDSVGFENNGAVITIDDD